MFVYCTITIKKFKNLIDKNSESVTLVHKFPGKNIRGSHSPKNEKRKSLFHL